MPFNYNSESLVAGPYSVRYKPASTLTDHLLGYHNIFKEEFEIQPSVSSKGHEHKAPLPYVGEYVEARARYRSCIAGMDSVVYERPGADAPQLIEVVRLRSDHIPEAEYTRRIPNRTHYNQLILGLGVAFTTRFHEYNACAYGSIERRWSETTLVMPHIPGASLAKFVFNNDDEFLRVLHGILGSLKEMHEKHQVVHGKLLAHNIIVERLTEESKDLSKTVKVTTQGFELTTPIGNPLPEASSYYRDFGIDPPELRGTEQPAAHPAQDVYSLGVLLARQLGGAGFAKLSEKMKAHVKRWSDHILGTSAAERPTVDDLACAFPLVPADQEQLYPTPPKVSGSVPSVSRPASASPKEHKYEAVSQDTAKVSDSPSSELSGSVPSASRPASASCSTSISPSIRVPVELPAAAEHKYATSPRPGTAKAPDSPVQSRDPEHESAVDSLEASVDKLGSFTSAITQLRAAYAQCKEPDQKAVNAVIDVYKNGVELLEKSKSPAGSSIGASKESQSDKLDQLTKTFKAGMARYNTSSCRNKLITAAIVAAFTLIGAGVGFLLTPAGSVAGAVMGYAIGGAVAGCVLGLFANKARTRSMPKNGGQLVDKVIREAECIVLKAG